MASSEKNHRRYQEVMSELCSETEPLVNASAQNRSQVLDGGFIKTVKAQLEDKRLRRNFPRSVFATATLNLGPRTVSERHYDLMNYGFGFCAIFACGHFNPDHGGFLILKEFGLVIRFPPGATVLIPSAVVEHSNVPVHFDEERYSFVQFMPSGLVRWVANGGMTEKGFREFHKLSTEESKERDERRLAEGLDSLTRIAG